jgi:hypothetical protein
VSHRSGSQRGPRHGNRSGRLFRSSTWAGCGGFTISSGPDRALDGDDP